LQVIASALAGAAVRPLGIGFPRGLGVHQIALIFEYGDIKINRSMDASSSDRVFEAAADLFSLLSAPTRLRIVCELSDGERNVSDLCERVGSSQPNLSQHLGMLYRGGVLGRRRVGAQVFYRIANGRVRHKAEKVKPARAPHGPDRLGAGSKRRSRIELAKQAIGPADQGSGELS
jgi:DNA-binding transcriptional ArsR family regulator